MYHRINTPNFGLETTQRLLADMAAEEEAGYAGTGLTWWLESLYRWRNSIEGMRQGIRQGPPRFEI